MSTPQQIDLNFHLHAMKVPGQTPGMQAFHKEHLSYSDSSLPCDTFNIIHVHTGGGIIKEELEQAVQHFNSKDSEYCIWVNRENLTPQLAELFSEMGINQHNAEVGMYLDMVVYQSASNPLHSNVKLVEDEQTLQDFASVIARHWTPTDQNVMSYYSQSAKSYLDQDSGISMFVYYHEGEAVSTLELFPSDHKITGIYAFATLEAYRGKGIGSAVMTYALNIAKEQGYQQVLLQATEDGIGIYKKLGFVEATMYFEYA